MDQSAFLVEDSDYFDCLEVKRWEVLGGLVGDIFEFWSIWHVFADEVHDEDIWFDDMTNWTRNMSLYSF